MPQRSRVASAPGSPVRAAFTMSGGLRFMPVERAVHRPDLAEHARVLGNALVDLFLQSRNWAFGSAVAVMLILVMLVTVTVYMRLIARLSVTREDVSIM